MTGRKNCASREGHSGKRVLIVDDDGSLRDSLKKVLEETGYSVATAQDGQEGANRLSAGGFDLLILDLDLPILSGWDILDLVRADRPLLPVIILTGELRQCERAAFLGSDVVLEKPCDVELLLKTLEKLIHGPPKKRSPRALGVRTGVPMLPSVAGNDVARYRRLTGGSSA